MFDRLTQQERLQQLFYIAAGLFWAQAALSTLEWTGVRSWAADPVGLLRALLVWPVSLGWGITARLQELGYQPVEFAPTVMVYVCGAFGGFTVCTLVLLYRRALRVDA